MNYKKLKLFIIGSISLLTTTLSFGQTRQEKTIAIINKINLIKKQKDKYLFKLESLKYKISENNRFKIIELENQLTEEEIIKRINSAFNKVYSAKEINDIYNFFQSSAFEKFSNTQETNNAITFEFIDIDQKILDISENSKKKIGISMDRKNGFYALVDYTNSTMDEDIKLEDKPSLTSKDILEVEKTINDYANTPEINILFTIDGAIKFNLLTKKNIGKPIAIVIAKRIISMPIVTSEITEGYISISGGFSFEEIDEILEMLKEK